MPKLDTLIHQPLRLRIMASLVALEKGQKVDFTYLKKLLDATDGNLGAHLIRLEDAGYIRMEKTFVGRKPKSFVSATLKGRSAFQEHVVALKRILNQGSP